MDGYRSPDVAARVKAVDAPNIDCVIMLRPTMSPGLYYQQVGRGFRLHPGKIDCLVLDYAGNVLRHGPVDNIKLKTHGANGDGEAPVKECPECQALIHAAYSVCPECGHEFPPPDRLRHDSRASTASVLSGEVTIMEYEVKETFYAVHIKRNFKDGDPFTMRVDYQIGWQHDQSEWICFEHEGYARHKAEAWWRKRSRVPVPDTAEKAVYYAEAGALAETKSITVRSVSGDKFDRIVGYELGDKPDYREPGWDVESEEESTHQEVFIPDDEPIPF